MLYGVVGKLESLNGLILNLPFLGHALIYFEITAHARVLWQMPIESVSNNVLGMIYNLFVNYYKQQLSAKYFTGIFDKII